MIRIGNASGYWGDDPYALRRQVLGKLALNYISMDFLAEVSMSILQKQRSRDPRAGYARDFLSQFEPVMAECRRRRIRIITNAGGVNPLGCAHELLAMARTKQVPLRVAVVDGDDILSRLPELRAEGNTLPNMETEESFEEYAGRCTAANVYFAAWPVLQALSFNPDVVICGRVTDTGLTLAAMMHAFGWPPDDYDRLAHGIVAGHIIECGAQATGGNFTDWGKIPSFLSMGYPILECYRDGSFVVTKHPGSDGLVSCQTVREQLLYEMGDPGCYLTPDCITDFGSIQLAPDGENRVRVWGIRGRPPTDLLKVSAAFDDGFKISGAIIISGPDARAKAMLFARIFRERLAEELRQSGFSPLAATQSERVGDDACHRDLTPAHQPTEILLRLSARDPDRGKLEIFRKLLPSLILSGPSGVAVSGGAPTMSRIVSYWPALIPRDRVLPIVTVLEDGPDGSGPTVVASMPEVAWPARRLDGEAAAAAESPRQDTIHQPCSPGSRLRVPLMRIAHARSGDKGDTVNIGLIGRSPACYTWLKENISAARMRDLFQGVTGGPVTRHEVPNLWALNFLLEQSLGGGGTMSLFIDAQGKTLSQAVLRQVVEIPAGLLETISPSDAPCPGELAGEPVS